MISAANFEKILRASRKHKVSKIILEGGEIQEVHFWAPGVLLPTSDVTVKSNVPASVPVVPFDIKDFEGVIADMPSDDEMRYYHSPLVPAPEPIPQEEQRKVS